MYYTVEDGEIKGMPHECFSKLEVEGGTITNFDKLTDEDKAKYGEYLIENVGVGFNKDFQARGPKVHEIVGHTVQVGHTVMYKSLDQCKDFKVNVVYRKAKELLDRASKGRSVSEISDWSQLKFDAIKYLKTKRATNLLSLAADSSTLGIKELAERIAKAAKFEQAVKVARKDHVERIMKLETPKEVMEYQLHNTERADPEGNEIDYKDLVVWPSG